MLPAAVHELLALQDGIVSRRQLLRAGGRQHDIQRWLRRRDLTAIHPGVYAVHNGPLTPSQAAWAAVLYAAPAALHGASALGNGGSAAPIHVAVDASRRIAAPLGIRIQRVRGLEPLVLWSASPPRVRVEHAVLELTHAATSELEVIRLLADGVGSRRTTAGRLRRALADRSRMRRRRWVERVLDDLETGACSVLEHGYLTRVERAHGLPAATRQRTRRTETGTQYRDVEYEQFGLVVELDGRVAHSSWDAMGQDADRDLDDLADGRQAVRLRYAQVFERACRTAGRLERILQRMGWQGRAVVCSGGCRLGIS